MMSVKNIQNSTFQPYITGFSVNIRKSMPEWMLGKEQFNEVKSGKAGTGFLRKTLAEIAKVLENDLLAERFAAKAGLLQGVDPRLKLLSMLLFMVLAGTARSVTTLLFLSVMSAMLVKLSKLDAWAYMKRVWLILPVMMLVLSLPAATSLFIKGEPLFYLYRGLDFQVGHATIPGQIYVSNEGLLAVVKMFLRVSVSISFGYALVMTTRWSQLAKSLGVLKVPKLIIAVLDMTYRYIFVLVRLSIEIYEARFLRTVGKIKNRDNRKFISNSIGFLFIRSGYISEEIYHAMLCRGYDGGQVSLVDFKLGRNDFVWIVNVIVILLILVLV